MNPVVLGFRALLVAVPLRSAAAAGLMVLWCRLTSMRNDSPDGLGPAIIAVICWAALSAFAALEGVVLAGGILGRTGEVSGRRWLVTIALALLAGGVCYIPRDDISLRGRQGVLSIAVSSILMTRILRFARRRWLGPPPPPPGMAG